jgi:hypothetical protein
MGIMEIVKMKYYDPTTRKRPDFAQMMTNYGMGSIVCNCGIILYIKQEVFEHWQQGHFDVYDDIEKKLPSMRFYGMIPMMPQ